MVGLVLCAFDARHAPRPTHWFVTGAPYRKWVAGPETDAHFATEKDGSRVADCVNGFFCLLNDYDDVFAEIFSRKSPAVPAAASRGFWEPKHGGRFYSGLRQDVDRR
jgi:hypothetical protein